MVILRWSFHLDFIAKPCALKQFCLLLSCHLSLPLSNFLWHPLLLRNPSNENPNLSFPLPYILMHQRCGLGGIVGWSLKPT